MEIQKSPDTVDHQNHIKNDDFIEPGSPDNFQRLSRLLPTRVATFIIFGIQDKKWDHDLLILKLQSKLLSQITSKTIQNQFSKLIDRLNNEYHIFCTYLMVQSQNHRFHLDNFFIINVKPEPHYQH